MSALMMRDGGRVLNSTVLSDVHPELSGSGGSQQSFLSTPDLDPIYAPQNIYAPFVALPEGPGPDFTQTGIGALFDIFFGGDEESDDEELPTPTKPIEDVDMGSENFAITAILILIVGGFLFKRFA